MTNKYASPEKIAEMKDLKREISMEFLKPLDALLEILLSDKYQCEVATYAVNLFNDIAQSLVMIFREEYIEYFQIDKGDIDEDNMILCHLFDNPSKYICLGCGCDFDEPDSIGFPPSSSQIDPPEFFSPCCREDYVPFEEMMANDVASILRFFKNRKS